MFLIYEHQTYLVMGHVVQYVLPFLHFTIDQVKISDQDDLSIVLEEV